MSLATWIALGAVVHAADGGAPRARVAGPDPVIAIVGVNVVPMDRDTVLADRTVIVRNGRIESIGARARTRIPASATRIAGGGKYLIPGLADMHAHLLTDGSVPDSVAADELAVMVANGVTTARLMIGTPEQLELRKDVVAGKVLGPRLYLASPEFAGKSYGDVFNGYAVDTPELARAAVRKAKDAGYDFIKLTVLITRPVYDAVIDEARTAGLRVIGHVDPRVGLTRALEAHQQIEHLDNHLEQLLPDTVKVRRSVSGVDVWNAAQWPTVDLLDETKIDSVAGAIARAGVYSTPTLAFFEMAFVHPQADADIDRRPDARFFPPSVRREQLAARDEWLRRLPSADRRERYSYLRNRFVKALNDHGAPIMAGSDSPEWPLLMTGFMLQRELQSLVHAGLTPYAALRAATVTPAQWLGEADAGVIRAGARADLVLLNGNPLTDIRNASHIDGVIANGRWLPRAQLERMLERAAQRITGTERGS